MDCEAKGIRELAALLDQEPSKGTPEASYAIEDSVPFFRRLSAVLSVYGPARMQAPVMHAQAQSVCTVGRSFRFRVKVATSHE